MNAETDLKAMSAKLVRLASRINLSLYFAETPPDEKKLRSYLREMAILLAMMESELEEKHAVDEPHFP